MPLEKPPTPSSEKPEVKDPHERYGEWSLAKKTENTPESLAEAEQADRLWEAVRILRGVNYWEALNDPNLKNMAEKAMEAVQEIKRKYPQAAEMTVPAAEQVTPWEDIENETELKERWLGSKDKER